MEEKDLESLSEYMYIIGGTEENSPSLHKYDQSNNSFQKVSELQKDMLSSLLCPVLMVTE